MTTASASFDTFVSIKGGVLAETKVTTGAYIKDEKIHNGKIKNCADRIKAG
jgi:hypothetical protein